MNRPDTPSPDRLAAVRRYAVVRAGELAAIDRIAAVLRDELPELSAGRADQVAARILDDVQGRLAGAFAGNPDAAARAVVAFAMGPV